MPVGRPRRYIGTLDGGRGRRGTQCCRQLLAARLRDLEREGFREVGDEAVADCVEHGTAAEGAIQRRDAFAADAARHDEVEAAEIDRDIVREAVRSDPTAQMHAEGAQFLFAARSVEPRAALAVDSLGREAEIGGRADCRFLKWRDVPAYVAPVLGQVQDRIADDLAWPVVSDVAT